jgi:phosphatidylinositol 3-kinase
VHAALLAMHVVYYVTIVSLRIVVCILHSASLEFDVSLLCFALYLVTVIVLYLTAPCFSPTHALALQALVFLEEMPPSLVVELPTFDIPILYEETFYPMPQQSVCGGITPLDLTLYRKQQAKLPNDNPSHFDPMQLVPFLDYEDEHDNPVEDKYRALAHDLLRGLVDPALKPDKEQRQRLATIIDSPSHHPTREEKDLLWRFRFSLVDNRRALTKFLLAVDWTVESEVVQAAELLEQWRKRSPIEVTDALKLLGKHVAFQTNLVRSYAIDTLAAAPDSELRLYLLQLVQALKYENTEALEPSPMPANSSPVSSLATFLTNRAAKNIELASFLYWYIKVELESPTHGARYREVFSALRSRLSSTYFDMTNVVTVGGHDSSTAFKSIVESVSKLGTTFRSSEGQTPDRAYNKSSGRQTIWDVLTAQDSFVSGMMDIQLRCRDVRGKRDAKEAQLQQLLSKEKYDRNSSRHPIPLPSAPDILVNGVVPETAKMFKSALYPALIEFHVEGIIKSKDDASQAKDTADNMTKSMYSDMPPSPRHDHVTSYKVIAKTGDDLRQDQLIIMMIQLMDGLLKRAALDLCLTPYSVIAMSPTSGLVEFIDGAYPFSQVLSQYNNSVIQFFQAHTHKHDAKHEVRPEVMSTYIRSCAGYCVITYILGIGDRHLDNILLRASGHFFHIDFGFAFGRGKFVSIWGVDWSCTLYLMLTSCALRPKAITSSIPSYT